jgi:hypothetical protein
MSESLAVCQIVDRNNLKIASTQRGAQNIPADPSESVDTHFGHVYFFGVTSISNLAVMKEWRI